MRSQRSNRINEIAREWMWSEIRSDDIRGAQIIGDHIGSDEITFDQII